MAKLIYLILASLDGYVADERGNFEWAAPDEEVHQFINDIVRPVGVHLYGRRMYETMEGWETMDTADQPPAVSDFAAMWRPAEKIVYSKALKTVTTERTRIVRAFDADEIRDLKAGGTDMLVGGPTLAAQAIRAGLVDSYHLFIVSTLVGGGLRAFPNAPRLDLALREQRRFGSGTVYLHYTPG